MSADTVTRLTRIAAALREAGDRGSLTALRRGLRTGAAPLIVAVRDAARQQLPKAGGLNEQVAGQRVRVATRMSARTTSVLLVTTAPDTAMTNAGYVRHPVYGRRSRWVTQQIPAASGWWTNTLEAAAPAVRAALDAEIDAISARIGEL